MCGRYTLFVEREDLEERFGARFAATDGESGAFTPHYNAAPGQALPVITDEHPETIRRLEWGLVPARADVDGGPINARAETLREKPSFRPAFERQPAAGDEESAAGRCLVLADGFYEWADASDGSGGGKRPYRIAFADDRPFAMAGLWVRRPRETAQTGLDAFGGGVDADDEGALETFAVVTTEPNDLVAALHHRMAAILAPDDEERWLTADDPRDALEPRPADELRAYPVSTAVNDPTVDEPSLVDPVDG